MQFGQELTRVGSPVFIDGLRSHLYWTATVAAAVLVSSLAGPEDVRLAFTAFRSWRKLHCLFLRVFLTNVVSWGLFWHGDVCNISMPPATSSTGGADGICWMVALTEAFQLVFSPPYVGFRWWFHCNVSGDPTTTGGVPLSWLVSCRRISVAVAVWLRGPSNNLWAWSQVAWPPRMVCIILDWVPRDYYGRAM